MEKQGYINSEYEIRVYKRKGMESSKQIMVGDSQNSILVGVCSLIQSTLDTELLTEQELKNLVNMVLEVRSKGAKNKIIYNGFKKGDVENEK